MLITSNIRTPFNIGYRPHCNTKLEQETINHSKLYLAIFNGEVYMFLRPYMCWLLIKTLKLKYSTSESSWSLLIVIYLQPYMPIKYCTGLSFVVLHTGGSIIHLPVHTSMSDGCIIVEFEGYLLYKPYITIGAQKWSQVIQCARNLYTF